MPRLLPLRLATCFSWDYNTLGRSPWKWCEGQQVMSRYSLVCPGYVCLSVSLPPPPLLFSVWNTKLDQTRKEHTELGSQVWCLWSQSLGPLWALICKVTCNKERVGDSGLELGELAEQRQAWLWIFPVPCYYCQPAQRIAHHSQPVRCWYCCDSSILNTL